RSRRPLGSGRPLRTRRSDRTAVPGRSLGALRSGWADRSRRALRPAAICQVDAAIAVQVLGAVCRPIGVDVPARQAVSPRWAGLAGGSQLALRTYLACRSLRARGAGGSGQTDRATLAYGSARARRAFRAPRPLRSRRAGRADQRAVVDVRQHPLQHGAELIDALVQARLTAGDLRLDSVHGAA